MSGITDQVSDFLDLTRDWKGDDAPSPVEGDPFQAIRERFPEEIGEPITRPFRFQQELTVQVTTYGTLLVDDRGVPFFWDRDERTRFYWDGVNRTDPPMPPPFAINLFMVRAYQMERILQGDPPPTSD